MYVISSLFATVLFATVLKLCCTSGIIFIKAKSSDHICPVEPCLTLPEFVSQHQVESNTVLKFLPGRYVLPFNTSKHISIVDVVNVTLTGVTDQQRSVIHCMSEFSIIAENVQNLTISKLYFSGCGALTPKGIITADDDSTLPRSVTLFLFRISNLSILDVHVHGSKGAGMFAVNAFDFILNQTSFVGNVPNCYFMFIDESSPPDKLHATSYITNSEFAYGISYSRGYGGGLSLLFLQTSHTVYVNIIDVALYNNTGTFWGNFLVSIAKWSCTCTMVQAEKVRSSNSLNHTGQLFTVEGVSYNHVQPIQRNHSVHFEYTVHVVDSYFDTGTGTTAVDIGSVYQENQNLKVKFTNISLLCHQQDDIYIGMYVTDVLSIELERIKVICNASMFSSVVFKHNMGIHTANERICKFPKARYSNIIRDQEIIFLIHIYCSSKTLCKIA